MISVCFQGRPFNITVIQVYVPTSNAEEAEVEWFYEDLQDYDVLFIVGNWNAKVGSKGFGLGVHNEAEQSLMESCQENALVTANTLFQQHKRRLYTWTSPEVNSEIRLIIFFAAKDGEALYSQKTRLGADCGSNHELLIAKFKLKLKKIWKTTRPFRNDLNQIPYDYRVEMTNRFKRLDLIDRVPEEL